MIGVVYVYGPSFMITWHHQGPKCAGLSVLLTFFKEMIPSLVSLSVDMEKTPEPSPFMIEYFMSAFDPVSGSFALILPTAEPTCADSGT